MCVWRVGERERGAEVSEDVCVCGEWERGGCGAVENTIVSCVGVPRCACVERGREVERRRFVSCGAVEITIVSCVGVPRCVCVERRREVTCGAVEVTFAGCVGV